MAINIVSLPVEVLIEIFKHFFDSYRATKIGYIGSTVVKECMDVEELLEESLFRIIGTSKLLYRIAEEVIYSHNTLVLSKRKLFPETGFFSISPCYLPNPCVRHWVNRIELRLRIPTPSLIRSPKAHCGCWLKEYLSCPHSDWSFLRNSQRDTSAFPISAMYTLDLILRFACTRSDSSCCNRTWKNCTEYVY
jgi:hypothetical protein